MREISCKDITEAVRGLFLKACLCPPDDVTAAIKEARERETSPRGREVLSQLLENADIAKSENIPYCQDTGMAVVFVKLGRDAHIDGDIYAAIDEGVRRAYGEGYLRKSVLSPIGRENTGDNTPAVVHIELTGGDRLHLIAAPKGFGSENMSAIAMLKPSAGRQGIVDFVVNTARNAGGNPCPPVVLGVGIGGTFEKAALMAKEQLCRTVGTPSPDQELKALEDEIKTKINDIGMGPMGIGGDNYCLAVNIAKYPTHLAGMPVAVNYCCHALRHADAWI